MKKKTFTTMCTALLLTLGVGGMMTSCAQNNQKQDQNQGKTQMKTLVTYFSPTGTTAKVAQQLASATNADLFEIAPAQPYSSADLDWTDKQSRSTIEMQDSTSRPAIAKKVDDMSRYDVVYIGFPIWWYTAPTIINTFIESYDWQDQQVILFATSGGSDITKAVNDLKATYPNVNWQGGQLLNAPSDSTIKAFTSKH